MTENTTSETGFNFSQHPATSNLKASLVSRPSQRGTTRMVQACKLSQKHFSNAELAQLFYFFGLFLGYIWHFPKGLCLPKGQVEVVYQPQDELSLWFSEPPLSFQCMVESCCWRVANKLISQLLCSQSNRCKVHMWWDLNSSWCSPGAVWLVSKAVQGDFWSW